VIQRFEDFVSESHRAKLLPDLFYGVHFRCIRRDSLQGDIIRHFKTALARLDEVRATWEAKYPGCMNRWSDNWDCISPMFKFSQTARKVMYTTNAIESLNSGFRRLNRGRTIFPNAMALTKALYLATWELTKKWTMPVRNWGQVYAELDIMFPGRLTRN
jgi:transposase-like protein